MTNNKTVIAELSNTQRITVKHGSDSVVIQKEYRKTQSDDWTTSKGIEIPNEHLDTLVNDLKK